MTALTDKQIDFKKIIYAFKSNKYTPTQIGHLFHEYYVKHLKDIDVDQDLNFGKISPSQDYSMFNGSLPIGDLDSP